VKEERVIADFFWGDVTAFGSGIVDVVLAYFKVAMGLSHAIRENAREVYPDDNRQDRRIRRLARGAALTIHGPIIALNIVMLAGLLLAAVLKMALTKLCPGMAADVLLRWQIAAVGLSAIVIGLLLLKQGRGAFLYRYLLSWVVLSGLAFLLLGLPELLPKSFGLADSELVAFIKSKVAGLEGITPENLKLTSTDILEVGWRLLPLMSAAWIAVFVQVFLVWVLGRIRPEKAKRTQVTNLIVPALALMSLLWLLLIAALWAAVLKLPSHYNLDLAPKAVAGALVVMGAVFIVLVLLAAAAGWVFFLKSELKREKFSEPAAYMDNGGAKATEYANRYRLLIASGMLMALSTLLPLVLATFVLVFISPKVGWEWVANTKAFLEAWTITIIFLILAGGSALVYWARAEFAAGIGILADVLAYLNNSSWISDDDNDLYKTGKRQRQTWLERRLFKQEDRDATNAHPRGYWLRRRIHDRLDVLIRTLIRDEKPDRLDIVSHSQGTMIAIDLIDLRGKDWKELPGSPGDMRLVTMGSPYTHLYGHYFPSSFLSVEDRPNLKEEKEGGLLRDWLNIFRIDDFVGTNVGKGVWPREFPVLPNGHTNYWVDRRVVGKLREFLKVDAKPPTAAAGPAAAAASLSS
jgi:hypothetical protein